MLRSLLVLLGLGLASSQLGCSMCQDCQDKNGPVAESGNYHDFASAPRSGSASVQSYEGPIEGEPASVEEEPQIIPTPTPATTRRRANDARR